MEYLPIAVRLKGRRAIVVGGGKVSERKIATLLAAKAKVHVIAPAVTPSILRLYGQGVIKWSARFVRASDIQKASLVIAATDDHEVNKSVSQWAQKRHIPVNVVDKPVISDFISPAVLRFKKALVAVYTDGRDPLLSRDLKNYLKGHWDDFLSYRNRS